MAMYWMETHYLPFAELRYTVSDGEVAAERYRGKPFFHSITAYLYLSDLQNNAMANSNRDHMFLSYRLPEGRVVADIGGADGTVLTQLLAYDPERLGIVFDLPEIVSGAAKVLARTGRADRVRAVARGLFRRRPQGRCLCPVRRPARLGRWVVQAHSAVGSGGRRAGGALGGHRDARAAGRRAA